MRPEQDNSRGATRQELSATAFFAAPPPADSGLPGLPPAQPPDRQRTPSPAVWLPLRTILENLHRSDVPAPSLAAPSCPLAESPACAPLCDAPDSAQNLRVLLARELHRACVTQNAAHSAFLAIQRGRFMEQCGAALGLEPPGLTLFLAGLCPALPPELLDQLPVLQAPLQLLAQANDAPAGLCLALLACIEAADWSACATLLSDTPLSGEQVAFLYGKAAVWTRQVCALGAG